MFHANINMGWTIPSVIRIKARTLADPARPAGGDRTAPRRRRGPPREAREASLQRSRADKSRETRLDDALRLAKVAGTADVRVDLQIWPEMIHVWHLFYPELKAGLRGHSVGCYLNNAKVEHSANLERS
jgi:hypothetical protein